MSYNTLEIFWGIFEMLFLSDVGYLHYFHLVLLLNYIIEMPWAQNLSALKYSELFVV